MTKERKGPIFTSKCGIESKRVMTIWWTQVTCEACILAMGLNKPPRKRLITRQKNLA